MLLGGRGKRSDPRLWSAAPGGVSHPAGGLQHEALRSSTSHLRRRSGRSGWRRPSAVLNVAITPARSRLTLVTSFGPDDIDPTANSSAGFQLMYRFMQFMSSGGASFSDDPGRSVEMNPFEVDVFNRLTAAGLSIEPQWGVGVYRLDFAMRHPEKPGRFVLAIECDGAMYHSGIVARERDRLRQRQLELHGWSFHRIWSTDWWMDPEPQIQACWPGTRLRSLKTSTRARRRLFQATGVLGKASQRPRMLDQRCSNARDAGHTFGAGNRSPRTRTPSW